MKVIIGMSSDSSVKSETFNYLQSKPEFWFNSAGNLLRAALELEKHRDVNLNNIVKREYRQVYYLLIGFCLECYYKGHIVNKLLEENNTISVNQLDKRLKGHDLKNLATTAGFEVEVKKGRDNLSYLTDCIKWIGRYPIPINANRMKHMEKYSFDDGEKIHNFLTSVEPIITVDEIKDLLQQARRNNGQ